MWECSAQHTGKPKFFYQYKKVFSKTEFIEKKFLSFEGKQNFAMFELLLVQAIHKKREEMSNTYVRDFI